MCRDVVQGPTPHYCNAVLRLPRNKTSAPGAPGPYITTKAADHPRKCHPSDPAAASYVAAGRWKVRRLEPALDRNQRNVGGGAPPAPRAGSIAASFIRKVNDDAKQGLDVMCMHLFVYGETVLPARFFEAKMFRNLMATAASLPAQAGYVPVARKAMPGLVQAEKARQLAWFKAGHDAAAALSGGKHLQVLHDAGTPANGVSFNVVAAQQVSPAWDRNDVWALSCRPPGGKPDADVAADAAAVIEGATARSFGDAAGGMMQDGGAKGTATQLGYDAEGCMLHSPDKVGASAIGKLVRTRKKKAVNPFPGAQGALRRARKVATVFSWNPRRAPLYKCAEMLGPPKRRPKLDNDTRCV